MFRKLHRTNAILLGVFISAHLINHLAIIGGVEAHLATMKAMRAFYRPVYVEAVLYALFGAQILLGFTLMCKQGRPRNRWGWAQYISGGTLTVFLLQHMGAALLTRMVNPEVDTNVYWAASVVSREPFVWYFAPYYALGILSIFVHVAAALKKRARLKAYSNWVVGTGVLVSIIVVPSLMGWYTGPINLPPEHNEYIENFFTNF